MDQQNYHYEVGAKVPAHLIFKYFGDNKMESLSDKDYILELQDKLWKLREKIEALESTIKFLKEEEEISKVAIQGCNQVFEINEKLKGILKAGSCPNCDGSGVCRGEHDIWQCEWCDARDHLLGDK